MNINKLIESNKDSLNPIKTTSNVNIKQTMLNTKITNFIKSKYSASPTSIALKQKRRSRFELKGRSNVCHCGQSYLSEPALLNHKRLKHNYVEPIKKSRGRPKKVIIKFTFKN